MPHQKMWMAFKMHFLATSRLRNVVSETTDQMGYNSFAGGSAETTENNGNTEELQTVAEYFAEVSNAAQQSFQELNQSHTALQGELRALCQQYDAIQSNTATKNFQCGGYEVTPPQHYYQPPPNAQYCPQWCGKRQVPFQPTPIVPMQGPSTFYPPALNAPMQVPQQQPGRQ